jgi:exosortase
MNGLTTTTDRLTARHLTAAALMGLLALWATLPAWQDIFLIARTDEENSQIFLVPIVAIYLVYVRRMRLRHCRVSFRMIGPLMTAAGWGIGCFGFYHGVQSLWHGGAVLVVLGCILSVLGKNVLFRFLPAVAVLVFLVPVPVRIRLAIAIPLQQWTAVVSQKALEVIGVLNTQVVGNGLKVNNHPVNIAEACNGVRMVFALVMVSYTFGFAMPLRNGVRALIVLASPLAAILCNVLRVVPTVLMIGYASQTTAEQFHAITGWLMLPVAFMILYGIIQLLRWALIPVTRYTLATQTIT